MVRRTNDKPVWLQRPPAGGRSHAKVGQHLAAGGAQPRFIGLQTTGHLHHVRQVRFAIFTDVALTGCPFLGCALRHGQRQWWERQLRKCRCRRCDEHEQDKFAEHRCPFLATVNIKQGHDDCRRDPASDLFHATGWDPDRPITPGGPAGLLPPKKHYQIAVNGVNQVRRSRSGRNRTKMGHHEKGLEKWPTSWWTW